MSDETESNKFSQANCLKKEIEKQIYNELQKAEKESRLEEIRETQQIDENIKNMLDNVRNENKLELELYEQLFKRINEKIKNLAKKIKCIGAELRKPSTMSYNKSNRKITTNKLTIYQKEMEEEITILLLDCKQRHQYNK